ncbi:inositol monophosphatase family protein [Couchioplanes azureus]|uniref:inositol monophosphatase family protein n=1 Tax=Couchioplanes caeruleus TaxID=56438 RepID=UPI0016711525|nr:inositol monophosphatase family protein [Couchioplanes caeruleus]GGQ63023.1 histidinol-phosphatase [Couchioplanes caeruleus subsp. azureus]
MLSDLDLARRAALTGASVALRHFDALADLPRERKPDGSVVTAADRDTEAAIREVLRAARPADAVLGEEGGEVGAGGRRRWIVDPIDGTAQFVSGDDRWLVLVALEVDGEIAVGAAAVPAQGTLWWASRGGGAFRSALDGTARQRVTVAAGRPDVLDGARLGVVPAPPNYLDTDRRIAAPLAERATTAEWDVHAPLLVASGGLDLAVQTRGELWDFAVTSLIVTEAGGAYGGADGIRGPRAGTSLFARSPQLWRQAHRALWRDSGAGGEDQRGQRAQ